MKDSHIKLFSKHNPSIWIWFNWRNISNKQKVWNYFTIRMAERSPWRWNRRRRASTNSATQRQCRYKSKKMERRKWGNINWLIWWSSTIQYSSTNYPRKTRYFKLLQSITRVIFWKEVHRIPSKSIRLAYRGNKRHCMEILYFSNWPYWKKSSHHKTCK